MSPWYTPVVAGRNEYRLRRELAIDYDALTALATAYGQTAEELAGRGKRLQQRGAELAQAYQAPSGRQAARRITELGKHLARTAQIMQEAGQAIGAVGDHWQSIERAWRAYVLSETVSAGTIIRPAAREVVAEFMRRQLAHRAEERRGELAALTRALNAGSDMDRYGCEVVPGGVIDGAMSTAQTTSPVQAPAAVDGRAAARQAIPGVGAGAMGSAGRGRLGTDMAPGGAALGGMALGGMGWGLRGGRGGMPGAVPGNVPGEVDTGVDSGQAGDYEALREIRFAERESGGESAFVGSRHHNVSRGLDPQLGGVLGAGLTSAWVSRLRTRLGLSRFGRGTTTLAGAPRPMPGGGDARRVSGASPAGVASGGQAAGSAVSRRPGGVGGAGGPVGPGAPSGGERITGRMYPPRAFGGIVAGPASGRQRKGRAARSAASSGVLGTEVENADSRAHGQARWRVERGAFGEWIVVDKAEGG